MNKYIAIGMAASALALISCGGKTHVSGGFTSGGEDEPPQSGIEVIVTDSRIDGAYVCIDLDGSGTCSQSDPAGFTGKDGKVFIGIDGEQLANAESYLVIAEARPGSVMLAGSEQVVVDLGFALAGRAYPEDIKDGKTQVKVSLATTAAEFDKQVSDRKQRDAAADKFAISMPKLQNHSLSPSAMVAMSGILPSNADELSHAMKTNAFTYSSYLEKSAAAALSYAGICIEMTESQDQNPSVSDVLTVLGHSAKVSVSNGLFGCGITGRNTILCQDGAEIGDDIYKFSGAYEIKENDAYSGLKPISGVKQLSAGISHACAATRSGEVVCWGSNAHGALGSEEVPIGAFSVNTAYKSNLSGLTGSLSIATKDHSTCATAANEEKVCWGQE